MVIAGRLINDLSLAHELMHVLLNVDHDARGTEPQTALFHPAAGSIPSVTPAKAVNSSKRIGPYPDADAAGVGIDDTRIMRANVETLP
jgi:hypothetical protein